MGSIVIFTLYSLLVALYLPTCPPDRPLQILAARAHIDLRRIETLMPQQHPDLVQGYAGVNQILGEGMPKSMGGTLLQPRLIRKLAHQLVNAPARQCAPLSKKECFSRILGSLLEITL